MKKTEDMKQSVLPFESPVLSELTRKLHFFNGSQTYWIVQWKSQQQTTSYKCAHGVMEFGTWVNVTVDW